MKHFWNNIFLYRTFFIVLIAAGFLFAFGHFYTLYYTVGLVLLALLTLGTLLDIFFLYRGSKVSGTRKVNSILSNGDINECSITIINTYGFPINTQIYEEIPYQLGLRELSFKVKITSQSKEKIAYDLEPKERGEYSFGNTIVLVRSPLSLVIRRYELDTVKQVSVYPSYIHLNKYNLKNFKYFTSQVGNKKTRKIGHSTEFEQIKDYVKGDDIRYINWKASAKKNQLMVNQYIDERAQQVYCLIDSGRAMEMPFDGLTLLDYSINSSLAISQVIIKNHDKAGVLYFNKKVEKILPADKATSQMPRILNVLYNLKTEFYESNFEKLYAQVKFKINHRSLLLLYTNFEDMNAMKRQLPYLKGLAKNNVLVVIFFQNSEIEKVIHSTSEHQTDYYYKSVSEKLSYQKKQMVKELNKNGIQSVLTDPHRLTIDSINKYLEIKARGLL